MGIQAIIAAAGIILAALIPAVGAYIRHSNELALIRLRLDHIERQAQLSEGRINEHDDRIHAMLLELKDDISSLRLIIEQRLRT